MMRPLRVGDKVRILPLEEYTENFQDYAHFLEPNSIAVVTEICSGDMFMVEGTSVNDGDTISQLMDSDEVVLFN